MKEHGGRADVELKWFKEPFENDLGIQQPSIQRPVSQSRVTDIVSGLREKEKKSGNIIQVGVLHIAYCKGVRYILDGQHRLRAYQELNKPNTIRIQNWYVNDVDEMEQLFKEINSNVPLEAYIFNPDKEYKLGCDAVVKYVETTYGPYIKHPNRTSATGNTYFPYIGSQTFRYVLPYIEDLKQINTDNAIDKFKAYNDKCKNMLKQDHKTKAEQMQLTMKCEPPYINLDVMRLWKKHSGDILNSQGKA